MFNLSNYFHIVPNSLTFIIRYGDPNPTIRIDKFTDKILLINFGSITDLIPKLYYKINVSVRSSLSLKMLGIIDYVSVNAPINSAALVPDDVFYKNRY